MRMQHTFMLLAVALAACAPAQAVDHSELTKADFGVAKASYEEAIADFESCLVEAGHDVRRELAANGIFYLFTFDSDGVASEEAWDELAQSREQAMDLCDSQALRTSTAELAAIVNPNDSDMSRLLSGCGFDTSGASIENEVANAMIEPELRGCMLESISDHIKAEFGDAAAAMR